MMDEFEMDSLDPLASSSSTARTAPRWPRSPASRSGTYRAEIFSDGYEEPVRLAAAMTVQDDGIEVDYAGTSGLSSRGINVPPAYCRAYSCFGIKCVVAPEIPNNWASLAPFRMKIPEGCILNAPRPYPVSVRHVIGHLLPDLMMGCLHQAVPERVHRGRRLGAVESAVARRLVGVRPGARQPPGAAGFRSHHLQLRRHRRAADAGRAERDRLSLRRAHDAGGGDGKRRADRHLDARN